MLSPVKNSPQPKGLALARARPRSACRSASPSKPRSTRIWFSAPISDAQTASSLPLPSFA